MNIAPILVRGDGPFFFTINFLSEESVHFLKLVRDRPLLVEVPKNSLKNQKSTKFSLISCLTTEKSFVHEIHGNKQKNSQLILLSPSHSSFHSSRLQDI